MLGTLLAVSAAGHWAQQKKIGTLSAQLVKAWADNEQNRSQLQLLEARFETIKVSSEKEVSMARMQLQHIQDKARANEEQLQELRASLVAMQSAQRAPQRPRPTIVRTDPPKPTVREPARPPVDLIQSTVQRRAKSFCEDQRRGVSGSLVFGVRVDYIGEPREVPGWGGRYEVAGEVSYNFYHSTWGGSFGSERQYFTAQVEVLGKAAKIVDFTPRSSEPLGF